MRKRILFAVLGAIAATAGLLGTTPGPASGQDVVPGILDVSAQIVSKPTVVSPPGAYALYEATIKNEGALTVDSSTLTVTLDPGMLYDDSLSTGPCSGSGATITCPVSTLAPQQTAIFDVVSSTPTSVGPAKATAHVTAGGPVAEPIEYSANNTSTATTDVQASSGAGAFALVRENQSLSYDAGDGRKYTLHVPSGVPGVIVSIRPDNGTGRMCGVGVTCGKGFVTEFTQHPYFKAEDPNNPIFTTKTFGIGQPCRGIGGGGDCNELYFAKSAASPVLAPMPACATAGHAVPSPCLEQLHKINGVPYFDVLMLSNDPVELPPLLLGR